MPFDVSLSMSANLKPFVKPLFSSRMRKVPRVIDLEKQETFEEHEMDLFHREESEEEAKNEWAVSVFKDNLRRQLMKRQYQKRQNSCIMKLQQIKGTRKFSNISRHDVNYVFLWAAFHGQLNLMQFCAEKGADVSFIYGNNNFNALHLAAMAGSVDCCEWLLEKGCRVIMTTDMMTPIHFAAMGNSKEVIKYLISCGCGVPSTAINSAVYANAIECVKLLLSLQDVDVNVYREGMTPLHVATDLRYIECMEELLNDPRIDANSKTELKGYTALHLAAENAYSDCIELLLSKGARINEANNKLQTPLHLACKMECLDCVETLLKNRASANERDVDKKTPLHAAIAKSPSSLAKVQALVRWKANVNVADRYGYTPLHLAAINESEECATFLILNGANVAAETKNGVSALNMMNRKTPKSVSAIWKRLTKSLAYNTEQSLKFSFRELITNSTIGEIGFLYTLQKEDRKDILMHPLCRAFLYLKWEKVKVIYFIRVFFVILTSCIVSFLVLKDVIKDETSDSEALKTNTSCANDDWGEIVFMFTYKKIETFFVHIKPQLWLIAILLVTSNVLRNLSARNAYPSFKRYLMNNLNLFEYIIMIFVVILYLMKISNEKKPSTNNEGNSTECPKNSTNDRIDDLHSLGKLFGTGVILLTWTYLTLVIGQLPYFGTYITMFNKVFKELLKLLTVYFFLFVGFTYTFSALFRNVKNKFDDFFVGFAQTLVMMTGELDANALLGEENNFQSDAHKNAFAFVLILFIVVVNMSLMNLLIGIAVSDVDGLRKTADLSKLVHQTKLIYYLEFAFFKSYIPKTLTFTKMLKKILFVSPDFYRVVIYVRPLNPMENRLPQDIMKEALQLALNKNKPDQGEDEVVSRLEKLENKIQKMHNLLLNLSNLVQDQKSSKERKDE